MRDPKTTMAQEQQQFLDVVDRDTAERRWWQAIRPMPLGAKRFTWLPRQGGCWRRTRRPGASATSPGPTERRTGLERGSGDSVRR